MRERQTEPMGHSEGMMGKCGKDKRGRSETERWVEERYQEHKERIGAEEAGKWRHRERWRESKGQDVI